MFGRAWLLSIFSGVAAFGCATGNEAVVVVGLADARTDTLSAAETPALDSTMTEVAADAFDATSKSDADAGSIFETDVDCDAGLASCGTACVNLAKDELNCGKCGKACAAGEKCVASACEIVCVAPTTKCGTTCVNTNNDDKNCGACAMPCATSESCRAGACVPPATTVTFPSTTSTTVHPSDGFSAPLGAGGGRAFSVAGDYVQQAFSRTAAITKLTVNFKMADGTHSYCGVGTLNWNVYINGTVIGSYSWIGGTVPYSPSPPMGPDQTISKTIAFASIAPVGGTFTIRLQAATTVCAGGGAWNWFPGGTFTLE